MKESSGRWLASLVVAGALLAPEIVLAQSAPRRSDPLAGVHSHVEGAMREWRIPGLALAVVKDDSVILARGYGVRQVGRPEPVDANTIFEVGSTGKAFTAAAVALLVDDGRVRWDDPVVKHLPGFRLYDPRITEEVTIRDLLSMRVGVEGWIGAVSELSREGTVRRIRHLEPIVPFRAQYLYSNLMYATATQVVTAAAGVTWDELIRTRIFEPAEMTSTNSDPFAFWQPGAVAPCFSCGASQPPSLDNALPGTNLAMPHMRYGDSVVAIPWRSYDHAAGAGAVNSSVLDLARWVRLHLLGGALARQEGTRPSLPLSAHAGPYADSALGTAEIETTSDGLAFRITDGATADLEHWHYDVFLMRWHGPSRLRSFVTFTLDERGMVATMSVAGMGELGRVPQ